MGLNRVQVFRIYKRFPLEANDQGNGKLEVHVAFIKTLRYVLGTVYLEGRCIFRVDEDGGRASSCRKRNSMAVERDDTV